MSSIDKRVSVLEAALTVYLRESGEIRSDIRWLKKAFWLAFTAWATVNTTIIGLIASRMLH